MTSLMPSSQKTKKSSNTKTTPLLPVMIVPGFMSSGLGIEHSSLKQSWEGERVWINLGALGFQALAGTSSQRNTNSSKPEQPAKDDDDTEEGKIQRQNEQYTNMWCQHMALSLEDQTTEHPEVQVRPMKGLEAVDYLTPGALTNHVSYVFGPVIEALKKAGYQEGVNLDAVPYDWRLTPAALEARDSYFTNTKRQIEQMYATNNNMPVVLVCHSLGAKVGHYILNWCERKEPGWCAKYVHTYCPVGGPILGAPKAIRGIVTGDKMGLDVFMNDADALAMARSFGSTPWLVPRELPVGAPSPCFLHRQGAIQIRIHQVVDLTPFLQYREDTSMPTELKLAVSLGRKVATTDFVPITDMKALLDGTFTFATDPEGPQDTLRIDVCEPGNNLARKNKKRERQPLVCCGHVVPMWMKLLFCYYCIRYPLEWAFNFAAFFIRWFLWKPAMCISDIGVKAAGGSSSFIAAKNIDLAQCTSTTEETDITVDVVDSIPTWEFWKKKESFPLSLHVQWTPPDKKVQQNFRASIATVDHATSSLGSVGMLECAKHKSRAIEPCSGYALLKKEKLNATLNTIEKSYNNDPNEPRNHTSDGAPPVGRIFAVYGINLPTEVGAVYRHRGAVRDVPVTNYICLDTSAQLKSSSKDLDFVVEKGIVLETKPDESLVDGLAVEAKCSGDGTVPYYSLRHVKTWSDSCNVTVKELEGAEHREILADERFHKILIDYVSGNKNGDDAV